VAVSLLERRGIRNAKNLLGGMTAWQRLDLPTKKDREHTITTPDIEGVRR
jgi:hydroxyacylglutathione hydrolase